MKNKLKWGALAPVAAAVLVLALAACNETYVGITEAAEAEASGEVSSSYTINDTTYLVDNFRGLKELTNNDTSWTWWDGATDYVSVSGNFCLVFWWTQSADDWADNTLEIIADSVYWDYSLGSDVSTGWGDLYSSDNANLVTGSSLLGDWQVVVLRYGTTLAVMATNSDYTFYYTDTGFTTSDCSIGFTGNPAAGIDEDTLCYMLGEVTGIASSITVDATYSSDDGSTDSVFSSVTVSYTEDGVNTITVTPSGGEETSLTVTANDDGSYSADYVTSDDSTTYTYTVTVTGSDSSYTYSYTLATTKTYTASASGTSLSEKVTVNATTDADGNVTVDAVSVGDTECTEGSDNNTWIYDTVVSYDSTSDAFTYTVYTLSLTATSDGYSYSTDSSDTTVDALDGLSNASDVFVYCYKVEADTSGYTPFLAGDTCVYYINGYSVGDNTTDNLSIKVDSSSAWWAGHYVVGESAQSSTTSSSSYSDIIKGASNVVTISSDSDKIPIAVWGTSSNSAGGVYNGPCLVLATSSAESLLLRTDPYGWDDWYDSDSFTSYRGNTDDEGALLKDCVWCWTITYSSTSETIITFQAYAVEEESTSE